MAIPSGVVSYRNEYRSTSLGAFYSGWVHLSLTSVVSLGAIAFAISRLRSPGPLEWLVVPTAFLIANLVEFLMHRGPMHRSLRPLGEFYERHTLQHHHFYTHDAMEAESALDFKMVLFPPIAIFAFLGVIGGPITALFFIGVSPNAGWLVMAVAVGYLLSYEWLHLAYHLPADSVVGRSPFLARLRRHHTIHHDMALMGRWNFNITFPICDRFLGTHYELAEHAAGVIPPPELSPRAPPSVVRPHP